MNNKSDIDLYIVGVGNQLKNFRFFVPRYQRSYEWKTEHIEDLFKDIFNAFKQGQREYFLGSIVVSSLDDSLELIDGQQRLATITILIAEIRNYYLRKQDTRRGTLIEENYLFVSELEEEEEEQQPRLKLSADDNEVFQSTILNQNKIQLDLSNKPKGSHLNIINAAELARKFIDKIEAEEANPDSTLAGLIKYIRDSVKLIRVDVPDYANAFTIFETLNARGLELTEADLIKNHLFSISGNRVDEVENKWVSMRSIIQTIEKEQEVVSFIKYYYASKYEAVRKKELYKGIKNKATNQQQAIKLAITLEENAKRYVAILNSDDNYWNDFNKRTLIKNYVRTINEFGIIHSRPLLLAILEHFDKKEIEKSLKVLISWSIRFRISGSVSSGTFENQFSQRAVDVRNGYDKNGRSVTTAEDLSRLMDIVPKDSEFEDKFAEASITSSNFARYVLRILEREEQSVKEPETIINADESDVNLEHVLPQNPSSNWGHISAEDAQVYYNRIGNLALLQKTPNSKIGNTSPIDKQPTLSASEIRLTRMIGNEILATGTWNILQIKERQKKLAKLAVKAWSI